MDLNGLIARCVAPSRWLNRFLNKPALPEQICTTCGHIGEPVRRQRGEDRLEIGIWLLMAAFAVCYVVTYGMDEAALRMRVPFPGMVVRLFGWLTKLSAALSAVYTIWRVSSEYLACGKCEHASMIPLDSPRGQKVRAEHHPKS